MRLSQSRSPPLRLLQMAPSSKPEIAMSTKQKAPTRQAEVGDVYLVEIEPGTFGVRRVLQERRSGRARDCLLATSTWFGKKPPRLDDPRVREILCLTHHSWKGDRELMWVMGSPPDRYQLLGNIPPTAGEKKLKSVCYGHWDVPLHQVLLQWRWDHDRKRLLRDEAREQKELEQRLEAQRQAQIKALKKTSLQDLRKKKFFPRWKNFAMPVAIRESRRIFRETIDALIPLDPPRNKKKVLEVLKKCVEQLNEMERKHECLATIECDDLVTELMELFEVCRLGKESRRLDEWIDW